MMLCCMQVHALNNERVEQLQNAAAARELELQTEFEALSNEMMERIEQQQTELQALQDLKQHKASGLQGFQAAGHVSLCTCVQPA